MLFNKLRTCKLIFLLLLSNFAYSQEQDYKAPTGLNNWYVELGGAAQFYSINYEKYLYKTYDDKYIWTARVGAGYNPVNFNILNTVFLPKNTFMFPFSTSILKGEGKEKLELGGGFTLFTKDFGTNEIVPHAIIGLRVIESNTICFKMSYVPFYQNGSITHWIGVSLGKNFSFK